MVQVDLVSFAPGEQGGPAAKKNVSEPVPSPAASLDNAPEPTVSESMDDPPVENVPEPEPVAVLKPDLSLKSKPKNLKELMAEKPRPSSKEKKEAPESKPVESAPPPQKKLEKKEDTDTQNQLARAMERLAKTVKEQDKSVSVSGTGTGPVSGSGTGGGTGRKGGTPLDFYKMVLQSAIQQNWVFNEMLAGLNQNMEVRILIKILKNGEIRDIIYETRSGNPYLDQSAKRAIQRANPLPALPPGMASYDVVAIFTPKGLK